VQTVRGVMCKSSLVEGRFGSNPTRLESMIRRGGTIDSSQRWHGDSSWVEPESAAVDEGGVGRDLAGVCRTQLSGMVKVDPLAGVNISGTGIGAAYASDVCQFHSVQEMDQMASVATFGISEGTREL
jgi:hypothetical protein